MITRTYTITFTTAVYGTGTISTSSAPTPPEPQATLAFFISLAGTTYADLNRFNIIGINSSGICWWQPHELIYPFVYESKKWKNIFYYFQESIFAESASLISTATKMALGDIKSLNTNFSFYLSYFQMPVIHSVSDVFRTFS